MKNNPGLTMAALAGLAAYLLLRPDLAAAAQVSKSDQDTSAAPRAADTNVDVVPFEIPYPTEFYRMNDPQANLSAFLYMIRASEHVYPRDVVNDACYSIFYGGSTFANFADHPVLTGEKKGVPLPDHICAASGLKPGCVSTAAGAYQFIKSTWTRLKTKLQLPDFGPLSQDRAAVALLDEIGALPLIQAGDIEGAIHKSSKIWASLPGSTAQQNPKKLAYALARFDDGLAQG